MLSGLRSWFVNYGFLVVGFLLVSWSLVNTYLWWSLKNAPLSSSSRVEGEGTRVVSLTDNCDEECARKLVASVVEEQKLGVSVQPGAGCDEACVKKIVAEAVASIAAKKTTTTATTTTTKSSGTTQTKLVVMSDGTSSSTADWTNLTTGQWLDTSLYGELVSATWEGWVGIPGGSGIVNIRLWDATNSRAVDGSEISFKDVESTSFYSGNISIWRGQNQYFIQAKSNDGSTVGVTLAKIKLIVK